MKALDKYFAHYAEAECAFLDGLNSLDRRHGRWQQVLVIPAYRESAALLEDKLPACHDRTLIVLVLNRPDDDSDLGWRRDFLATLVAARWQQAHLSLHRLAGSTDMLLVDRCATGLARRQGVGLARKIGADIACKLIADGRIDSRWIHTTDADAILPEDYFNAVRSQPGSAAACCYPFRHVFADGEPQWPTLVYEWHLHYYVLGLRHAGSPYAFHTVGSTLAIDYRHYAQVRGFPRRAGGEDFYLLNKLAKTGSVVSLPEPVIELRARYSDRVPFGTGPATRRIAALTSPADFSSYHPACFTVLHDMLRLLDACAAAPEQPLGALIAGIAQDAVAAELLTAICHRLDVGEGLSAIIRPSRSAVQRRRQLHLWFDAFRSLKTIHLARELRYANLNLCQLLEHRSLQDILPEAAAGTAQPLEQSLNTLVQQMRRRVADGRARSPLTVELQSLSVDNSSLAANKSNADPNCQNNDLYCHIVSDSPN